MIMCGSFLLTDTESEEKFICQNHDFSMIYSTKLLNLISTLLIVLNRDSESTIACEIPSKRKWEWKESHCVGEMPKPIIYAVLVYNSRSESPFLGVSFIQNSKYTVSKLPLLVRNLL